MLWAGTLLIINILGKSDPSPSPCWPRVPHWSFSVVTFYHRAHGLDFIEAWSWGLFYSWWFVQLRHEPQAQSRVCCRSGKRHLPPALESQHLPPLSFISFEDQRTLQVRLNFIPKIKVREQRMYGMALASEMVSYGQTIYFCTFSPALKYCLTTLNGIVYFQLFVLSLSSSEMSPVSFNLSSLEKNSNKCPRINWQNSPRTLSPPSTVSACSDRGDFPLSHWIENRGFP